MNKLTDQQRMDAEERWGMTMHWEHFEDVRIGYEPRAKVQIKSCIFWQGFIADIGIKMITFKRDYLADIFPNGFEVGVGRPFPDKHKVPEILAFITLHPKGRCMSLKIEISDTGLAFEQFFTFDGYGRHLRDISPTVRHIFQIESHAAKDTVRHLLDHVFTQFPLCIMKQAIYDKFFEHVKAEQAKG